MNLKANQYIREVKATFSKNLANKEKIYIKSASDAYKLFNDLTDSTQEKLITLHLASDNSILCFQIVSIETINTALVNPADIMRTALLTGATALIVLHNHPSGNTEPSPADKEITEKIKQACELFQINLFDHIIIGDGYYSFADHELL